MKRIWITALSVLLTACTSTPYQPSGLRGGFTESQLREDVWRVRFSANGFSTRETAQTYWLYRCAELTLNNGYQGFQLLSDIRFVELEMAPANAEFGQFVRTAAGPVYVPIYTDQSNHPLIEGDIRLLRKPFQPAPPKIFDAAALKNTLERYVNGEKCSSNGTTGNVCPHVHDYLLPRDAGSKPGA